MPDRQPLVELRGVTKIYRFPRAEDVAVLGGVDLALLEGEMVSIVGPSGSGKSTLLNIVGTLDEPTSGTVILDGTDVSSLDEAALARVRTHKIGFVFQFHHLLPQCTVLENVLVPTLATEGGAAEEARERASHLLADVGLSHRLSHRPGILSGGERQRVAVVRALIDRPAVLLADEPTGSLDRTAADALGRLLADLNRREGVAVLMVTHSERLARGAGRMLELRDGVLVDAPGETTP